MTLYQHKKTIQGKNKENTRKKQGKNKENTRKKTRKTTRQQKMQKVLITSIIILLLLYLVCNSSFDGIYSKIEGFQTQGQQGSTEKRQQVQGQIKQQQSMKTNKNTRTRVQPSGYDTYNHYTQTSLPLMYYGPNGQTARVVQLPHSGLIVITSGNSETDVYYISNQPQQGQQGQQQAQGQTYNNKTGQSAKLQQNGDGEYQVVVTDSMGQTTIFNAHASPNEDDTNNIDPTLYNTVVESMTNYGSGINSTMNKPSSSSSQTTQTIPSPNQVNNYNNSANSYYAQSQGIPKSQIPPGEEDLYILKSQVVLPTCPPNKTVVIKEPGNKDCPPCQPCGRCPEPDFTCKKVPNFDKMSAGRASEFLPMPVLSDFSQFGM